MRPEALPPINVEEVNIYQLQQHYGQELVLDGQRHIFTAQQGIYVRNIHTQNNRLNQRAQQLQNSINFNHRHERRLRADRLQYERNIKNIKKNENSTN